MAGLTCVSFPGQAGPDGSWSWRGPASVPGSQPGTFPHLPPPLCPLLDLFKLAEQGEVGRPRRRYGDVCFPWGFISTLVLTFRLLLCVVL